jgi:hypothetical protein
MSTHYPHLGRTSETSISFYETKRGNISEGCYLHTRSQVSFENDYKFLERTNRNEVIKLYIVEDPFQYLVLKLFSSHHVLQKQQNMIRPILLLLLLLVVSYKASHTLRPFSDLLIVPNPNCNHS